MIEIATASVTSSAPPAEFFARWADVSTWSEWSPDVEWMTLNGEFAQGATGIMKPKGGPKVPFVVERLNCDEFVDVSRLFGARLTVDHQVRVLGDGRTTVTVRYTMAGPLARLWTLILGKGLRTTAQPDLSALAAVAQKAHTSS